MTILTTATKELNVGQIILLAYKQAALMPFEAAATGPQWDARAAHGRDVLEVIVDHIQAEGNITRDMALYPVTLTAGTATYTLPADTLRVQDTAMYQATTGDIELQCRSMGRDEYERISNKTQSGRPTRYYPAIGGAVTVTLYFVPDTTGSILTVQRQRLLADVSSNSATVDLERSWTMYLVWQLAHHFSVQAGQDVQRCGYLRAQADKAFASLKTQSDEYQPTNFHVSHGVRGYR